ncbi:hypothetical protein [Streptomyces pseudovenezuelae]|uniref:Uncharacterized protein n=1 Tax=Streptomyces pseudovenezuelae TaxID=67350 RepID=A0ABZ1WY21_9ACTN|nr:hypothetical protein [Streptomyces pseudovenezuelae]
MGIYVAVRGWLECDKEQLAAAQEIISSHEDGHYSHGWGAPGRPVNWTHYLFYGADIRESAVDWLMHQIRDMARIPANEDGDRVTGLFLASHEIDGMTEWQVREGRLLISPGDGRHRYLDG